MRVAAFGVVVASVCPVGGADAAGYYTRKRVNGVWITGVFPKDEGSAPRATRARSARIASLPLSPPLPPLPEEEGVVRDARVETEGDGPSVTSALPILNAPAEIADQIRLDERLGRLKDALQARAEAIAATVGLTAAPAAPVVPTAASLEARPAAASGPPGGLAPPTMPVAAVPPMPAVAATLPAAPMPRPAPASPLEPKSVSYDFETGIKTTVFENSVVREPFDPAAMKGISPRGPVR